MRTAPPDADPWTTLRHDLRQPLQALKLLHGALRRAAVADPVLLEMLEAQKAAIAAIEQRIEALRGEPDRIAEPGGAGAGEHAAAEAATGECILIVDDDPLIRRAWERLLTGEGYRTAGAASLAEARALLASSHPAPALLVTDYQLRDGANGLAVVQAVRGATGTATPALVITGEPSAVAPELAQLGNCRIMAKPVGPAVLLDLVRSALR